MQKVNNNDEHGVAMMNNQTVRQDDDSPGVGDHDDDDPFARNNPIEREPEREPDYSYVEGDITKSVLENEQAVAGYKNI